MVSDAEGDHIPSCHSLLDVGHRPSLSIREAGRLAALQSFDFILT